MSQHIGLCIEDLDGNEISVYKGWDSIDLRILVDSDPKGPYLRFIDPYGDTV